MNRRSWNVENFPVPVRGMTADQIMEEVRSFVPSQNGNIHAVDDETLSKEDITTFTKKITTGMTKNKVTMIRNQISLASK